MIVRWGDGHMIIDGGHMIGVGYDHIMYYVCQSSINH